MRPSRGQKLRTLNRFSVRKTHPYRLVGGDIDWNRPVYRVRPRGWNTVLAIIEAKPGTDNSDLDELMRAIEGLCDLPAPPQKVRS